MSTNLIDNMSERDAKSLLNDICSELGIGGAARTPSTIVTNVSSAFRRSRCLGRIECELTETLTDDDGEEYEDSLLNWGECPSDYINTFKKAIKELK